MTFKGVRGNRALAEFATVVALLSAPAQRAPVRRPAAPTPGPRAAVCCTHHTPTDQSADRPSPPPPRAPGRLGYDNPVTLHVPIHSQENKPVRIVLIGPPGAGKGTQARFLAEHLSIPMISTGDLFRAHVAEGTALGREAQKYMDTGALVPDEVTTAMTTARLAEKDASSGFILDGFPRTVRQAELLQQALTSQDIALDRVLAFDVPDDEIIRRLASRRTCGDCGLIQHTDPAGSSEETTCQACGGALQRRDDDREETVRKRLAVYTEQTVPLLDWYADRGLLARVTATGPVEEVTRRVFAAVLPNTVA